MVETRILLLSHVEFKDTAGGKTDRIVIGAMKSTEQSWDGASGDKITYKDSRVGMYRQGRFADLPGQWVRIRAQSQWGSRIQA